MSSEFEARFAWANPDAKVYVIFVVQPEGEHGDRESAVSCRVERFVEYRSDSGMRASNLNDIPNPTRQQIERSMGTKCSIQLGVRLGGIKYIEQPIAH